MCCLSREKRVESIGSRRLMKERKAVGAEGCKWA